MAGIRVVTIGRHYCSGGSDIGKMTAQKLGVKCYDREIIEMAAKRSGISMDEIKKYEESVLNPMKTPIALFGRERDDITEKIFAAETEVVQELAKQEDCVIVGRCADFILKNTVRTLDVFIYSSFEKRMDAALNKHHIPPEEVESRLKKYDKKRGDYYNANTNKKWGEKASYDMCLDSGKLGFDMCAEIIALTVQASR
ncbi:MAG: cytidylate kinase-like family protein [Ruminococcus sp.]|nr:cytidylate kinase-like family protein [Ruminococcus sp.]